MSQIDAVDLEVQHIFHSRKNSQSTFNGSNNCHIASPGSPVLNSIHSNKNTLISRRRSFKNRSRARIKLAEKFENNEVESELSVNQKTGNGVTEIVENSILNDLKFLLEDSKDYGFEQKTICESRSGIDNDLCFKKPPSPSKCQVFSPKLKIRNFSQSSQCKYTDLGCKQSKSAREIQTVSQKQINSFTSQNGINSYQNSYSVRVELSPKDNNLICENKNGVCNQNLSNTSSDKIETEISSVNDLESKENDELSMTQEIFDSGFTNSQLSNAFDILENYETQTNQDQFPGFEPSEITNSEQLYNKLVNVIEESAKKSNLEKISIPKLLSYNKHTLDGLFLPPSKRLRVDWNSKGSNQLNTLGGFATASGSSIKVTEESLKKTKSIFDNLDEPNTTSNKIQETIKSNSYIHQQNGKVLKPIFHKNTVTNDNKDNLIHERHQTMTNLTKDKLKFFDNLLDGCETENVSDFGFMRAANKLTMPTSAQLLPKNMVNSTFQQKESLPSTSGFNTPKRISNSHQLNDRNVSSNTMNRGNSDVKKSMIAQEVSRNKLKYFDQMIEAAEKSKTSNDHFPGFSKPVHGFQINNILPKSNKEVPQCSFTRPVYNTMNKMTTPTMGFLTASGRSVEVSEKALKSASDVFQNINDFKQNSFVTPLKAKNTLLPKRKKRFGGIIPCKQIPVSEEQLRKGALLFNEDLSAITPLRPFHMRSKNPSYHSTPIRRNNFSSGKFINSPITPIRSNRNNDQDAEDTVQDNTLCNFVIEDSNVIVTSPTKVECVDWFKEIENEKKRLEERLKIIEERQRIVKGLQKESSKVDGR